MTNKIITDKEINVESIIDNFDSDITYQIQNTGGRPIIAITEYNNDVATRQYNTINNLANYKRRENTTVYFCCLKGQETTVAITILGE